MFHEPRNPSSETPAAPAQPPLDSVHDRLVRVRRRFGERLTLVSALGPQSLLILDLLAEQGAIPNLAFLDTGAHFAETLSFLGEVEARYGVAIERLAAADPEPEQWTRDPRACCAARKVEPLRRHLVRFDAWISGIRADQTEERRAARAIAWDDGYGLWKVSPLVDWSRPQVLAALAARGVPTHPLLSRGFASVGCAPCTRPSEDERGGRFVGQARRECGIHLAGAPALRPTHSFTLGS